MTEETVHIGGRRWTCRRHLSRLFFFRDAVGRLHRVVVNDAESLIEFDDTLDLHSRRLVFAAAQRLTALRQSVVRAWAFSCAMGVWSWAP